MALPLTKPGRDVFAPVDAAGNVRSPSNGDAVVWSTEIERGMVGAAAGLVSASEWTALAAILGTRAGQPGRVPPSATGSHIDPVVGGSVPDQGEYAWSVSPAGWRRIANAVDLASKAEMDALDLRAPIRLGNVTHVNNDMTAADSFPLITSINQVHTFWITALFTNSGPVTLKIGTLAAVPVHDQDGAELTAGSWSSLRHYLLKAWINGGVTTLRIVSSNVRPTDVAAAAAIGAEAALLVHQMANNTLADRRGWPGYPAAGAQAMAERSPGVIAPARTTVATRINALGYVETVPANTLQHEYDPTTGAYLGWKIQPPSANLFTVASDFTDPYWTKVRSTVIKNIGRAPDGSMTLQRMEEDTQTGAHALLRGMNVVAGEYTTVAWTVRGVGRDACIQVDSAGVGPANLAAYFNLTTGKLILADEGLIKTRIRKRRDGFWRISVTFLAVATASMRAFVSSSIGSIQVFAGEPGKGLDVQAAQFETGRFDSAEISGGGARAVNTLQQPIGMAPEGTIIARFRLTDLTGAYSRIAGAQADH